MGDTKIEWATKTWNPVTGCSKVSQGCKHCYAETQANRFWGERSFTDVQCHSDRLEQPFHWRKPQRVFVNSMSDLFHEDLSPEFIADVFAVMAACKRHTFLVLTKRPEKMKRLVGSGPDGLVALWDIKAEAYFGVDCNRYPLDNVWLGVSAEDQATADERIPLLLDTPAAVRFVSYEPALGPVDFAARVVVDDFDVEPLTGRWVDRWGQTGGSYPRVDWIIVGGESGPKARPFDLAWARQTIVQCRAAGVPVFVKQVGSRPYVTGGSDAGEPDPYFPQLDDRKGGDMEEWPEDLRVREFPEGVAS